MALPNSFSVFYRKYLLAVLISGVLAAGCSGGTGGPTDGGQDGDAGTTDNDNCPQGQTECSGVCVDTHTDSLHCGGCDNACPSGQVCRDGICSDGCNHECPMADAKQCNGTGYEVCGDHDSDDCLEWGGYADCPADHYCQSGECLPNCSGGDCWFEGYTLFNPNNSRNTYLIDMNGQVVHSWSHTNNGGYSVYLLESGNLIRPAIDPSAQLRGGASAGIIQEIDWNENIVWEFTYSSSTYVTHHDVEPMPNGNVLLIAWEVKTASEAVAAGRAQSREMWPDHIIEVAPDGTGGANIVWEWHVWDHLIQDNDPSKDNWGVVADHPELVDVNLALSSGGPGGNDWLHINGISYNPELDQIVISSHFVNEFYVIDHSTTTTEAAGHTGGIMGKGGDILYRWGNPQNYDTSGAQYFDVIHDSRWIPADLPGGGNILVFNNGAAQRASEVVEIIPPYDVAGNYVITPGSPYGPASPTWTYSNNSFYSNHLGCNQRLPNGNTLICESTSGYLFEVTEEGEVVWEYSYSSEIARALRYSPDYPGLANLNP